MFPVLVLAAIAVPFIELVVLIWVADLISWWLALPLFLALPFVGVWVLRTHGVAAVGRVRTAIRRNELPGPPLVDACLVGVAGLLLVVPGFVTAALGGLLLIPQLRELVGHALIAWLRNHFTRATVIAVRVTNEDRGDDTRGLLSNAPGELPPVGLPDPTNAPGAFFGPDTDTWYGTGDTARSDDIVAGRTSGSAWDQTGEVAVAGANLGRQARERLETGFFDADAELVESDEEAAKWADFENREWEEGPGRKRKRGT